MLRKGNGEQTGCRVGIGKASRRNRCLWAKRVAVLYLSRLRYIGNNIVEDFYIFGMFSM
jgi:hypothetical protein